MVEFLEHVQVVLDDMFTSTVEELLLKHIDRNIFVEPSSMVILMVENGRGENSEEEVH